MAREPCIVAMGGGGFDTDGDQLLLDYICGLTGKDEPRICFVPTASGDSDSYIVGFYEAINLRRCRPSHLAVFTDRRIADLEQFLLSQDIVYVGGGNTANLVALWRLHGLDDALKEAWKQGVVLCGVSAGATCWFQGGPVDSFGSELQPLTNALALLDGSFCPHYDNPQRRESFRRFIAAGALPPGLAAEDGVGLRFSSAQLIEAVTWRPDAQAWRVELQGGVVSETALATRSLI